MMSKLLLVTAVTALTAATALAQDKAAPAKPATPASPATPAKPATPGTPATPATPATGAPAAWTPPPPAPELATTLKPFEGKWKCDGKVPDSPMGKAHAVKADITNKSDLNGYWYMERYEEKKSKENPAPMVMQASIGFDPSKKQIVRTDVDNYGMVMHSTTKGWEGDKLVWTGEVMGPQKMTVTTTMTKKSDKEMLAATEVKGPDGKVQPMGEMTCKK